MDVALHPGQQDIFCDPHRYKVVAAGRRFGKSFLAAVLLFVEASKMTKVRSDGEEIDLSLEEVYYVAPTFEQGKKILWPLLKTLGEDLIASKYENTGTLSLVNGRRISIKGSDRPDSLRGVGLSYVVLDEYAFMKEEVWEAIIRPALTRAEGGALFIGTPDIVKNHFYDLWARGFDPGFPEWRSWLFFSKENPFLPQQEIEEARKTMSSERFKREYEASFDAATGYVLLPSLFPVVERRPDSRNTYIAIDLAGFVPTEGGRKLERRDSHSIAVVDSHKDGWCIADIISGQWDTRETALRIVKAWRDYRPVKLGIEKGMARMAVMPYLEDEMNRLNTYFNVEELTHGNNKKADRIAWALQGRAEKGRIQLFKGDWNRQFLQECKDFPSPMSHDDMIDSVAYIDQLADPWSGHELLLDDSWMPLDKIAGY